MAADDHRTSGGVNQYISNSTAKDSNGTNPSYRSSELTLANNSLSAGSDTCCKSCRWPENAPDLARTACLSFMLQLHFLGVAELNRAVFDRMPPFRTSEMIHSHDLIQRSAGRQSRCRNRPVFRF